MAREAQHSPTLSSLKKPEMECMRVDSKACISWLESAACMHAGDEQRSITMYACHVSGSIKSMKVLEVTQTT